MTAGVDPILQFLAKVADPAARDAVCRAFGTAASTIELELGADATGPAASYTLVFEPPSVRVVEGELERALAPGAMRLTAPRGVFARVIAEPQRAMALFLTGQMRQQGHALLGMRLSELLALLARLPSVEAGAGPEAAPPSAERAIAFQLVPTVERRAAVRRACAHVEIQPALLGALFGAPADGVQWRSSGTYRFEGVDRADVGREDLEAAAILVDLYDEEKVFEATGDDEHRRAADFWSSEEAWGLELAVSDPSAASPFLQWLSERIDAASRERIASTTTAVREHLAAGAFKEAQRALWAAWPHVAPDPQLEGASARTLRALKAELEAAKTRP